MSQAWLAGSEAVLIMMSLVWLVSLRLQDVSIVDIFWGLGFVLAAWVYRLLGPTGEPRHYLLLALVSLWGVRLAAYIWSRGRGRGEDPRYAAMRRANGKAFPWLSLWSVFLLQGALIALISLPHLAVQAQSTAPRWLWTDLLGVIVWLVGFVFEVGGDWQLARFKADPANRGRVLRTGFWALSRHPNYFGDAAQWWGFWLIALAAPLGWATVISPLLMTALLLKVSGVALLEKTITQRRPEYRDYLQTTSAFFPRPPKRRPQPPPSRHGAVG